MGGAGLSRLWSSHPRVAFVLHLLFTLLAGYATFVVFRSGAGWGALFVFGAFLLMAASLVLLTWAAIKDGWRPDYDYAGYGTTMVSPRAAWANTRGPGKALWPLFAVGFLMGFVLLLSGRTFGVALILLAFVTAIVAMRLD